MQFHSLATHALVSNSHDHTLSIVDAIGAVHSLALTLTLSLAHSLSLPNLSNRPLYNFAAHTFLPAIGTGPTAAAVASIHLSLYSALTLLFSLPFLYGTPAEIVLIGLPFV